MFYAPVSRVTNRYDPGHIHFYDRGHVKEEINPYSEPTAHPWREKAVKYRQIRLGKKCVKTARYGG